MEGKTCEERTKKAQDGQLCLNYACCSYYISLSSSDLAVVLIIIVFSAHINKRFCNLMGSCWVIARTICLLWVLVGESPVWCYTWLFHGLDTSSVSLWNFWTIEQGDDWFDKINGPFSRYLGMSCISSQTSIKNESEDWERKSPLKSKYVFWMADHYCTDKKCTLAG